MNDVKKAFLSLMHDAYFDAKYAHQYSTETENSPENPSAAIAYANSVTAKACAAEAIYWCNEELYHDEIPELLHQFRVFSAEILQSYATDHSRQWVSIEFNNLKDLFESSVCKQPITE